MSTRYELRGPVAVITLDNPPVNGLGHATRAGIVAGIERANADPAVAAIVLIGAGKAFSGGADIREFNTPSATAEPTLGTVIRTVEASGKPVVAAIGGACMGGGLELALGCHFRVASPDAQIALPEVRLGLLPGAGGTQRLPRVVGVETALRMIVGGASVAAGELRDTRIFDAILDGDLLDGALAFARKIVAEARPAIRVRDIAIDCPDAANLFQRARDRVATEAKHYPAPHEMHRRGGRGRDAAVRRRHARRTPAVPGARAIARVARAAPRVLRGAGGGADSRRAGDDADTEDRIDRRRRRRHDGYRHRDERPQRRHSGRAARNEPGSARQGRGDDPPELRELGAARKAHAGQARAKHGAAAADAFVRRSARRRSRHRGRVRGDGPQAAGVRCARRRGEARRHSGHQHVDARRERHRRRHRPSAGRARDALLQSCQRDEAAGSGARRQDGKGRADDRDAVREEDRQDGGGLRRLRRLHRQPDARAVPAAGDVPAGRRRHAAAGRRRAGSLRHGDGSRSA